MMSHKRKILIISNRSDAEDDIKRSVGAGVEYTSAPNELSSLKVAQDTKPDIVVFESQSDEQLELVSNLRNQNSTKSIYVLVWSPLDSPEHRIKAYNAGADDFMSQSTPDKEVQARIVSKLKRLDELAHKEDQIQCGNLILDLHKLEAQVDGKLVELSVLEFSLLKYFVLNKEHILSRETILDTVWRDGTASSRAVDTHVASLRKILSSFDHAFVSVYGSGYILKKK